MRTGVLWRELVGIACLALAAAAPAGAAEPRETPEDDRGRTARSFTVVTRQEIERRQWRTLVELLQAQPGLHASQLGGIGQPVQLFVRGQRRGRVLVRLDGIEISDPASKDPGTVLPDLLTVDIERVEVWRGPQGVAGGNDALGGLIDITTRRGSGPAAPWARVEAGAFGTYQSSGGIRGGSETVDYALSYTHLHSRGISVRARDDRDGERDGYDNDSVGGRLDLRPADGLRLGLTGRLVDSERGLDAGFVGLDDPTDPSPATLNLFDLEGSRRDARRLFLRGEAELALFDDRWTQQWSVSYTDHASAGRVLSPVPAVAFAAIDPSATPIRLFPIGSPIGPLSPGGPTSGVIADPRPARTRTDSDSSRLELVWTHALRLAPGNDLRFGGQVENETFHARTLEQDATISSGFIGADLVPIGELQMDLTTASHERARNLSAFVEGGFTLGAFFAEIGARLEDHDEFGSQPSYRVGLGYLEQSSQLKLFASFGTAFRDPDLAVAADTTATFLSRILQPTGEVLDRWFLQVSRPVLTFRGSGFDSVLVEADVEAEQVRAAELGAQAPFLDGRGEAGLALFATRSRRLATRGIVSDRRMVVFETAFDTFESKARGVETWLRLDVSEGLGLQLDYTYTRSRLGHDLGVFDFAALGGDPELGIPTHRGNVALRYAPVDAVEGWVALRYVGRRTDEETLAIIGAFGGDPLVTRQLSLRDEVTRGAYTTVDVGLRFRLRPGVTLFARVENLFDREYNDPGQVNGPGRAGYLGVQVERP